MDSEDKENNSIKLCSGSTNCATISIENTLVRIDDNYGNHVLITHAEANLFYHSLIVLRSKTQ